MLGEDDLSSRFDYLFEPLVDESADDTVDAASPVSDPSDDKIASGGTAPVRIAFAAFVIAALGAVAVVAALLVQRPDEPADPVDTPLVPAPLSTTVPNTTRQPDPVPPALTTASAVPTEVPQTIDSGPQQLPASEAPATTSNRKPEAGVTNSPSTRAPISVSPEERPPFPNQTPGGGNDGGGGLL